MLSCCSTSPQQQTYVVEPQKQMVVTSHLLKRLRPLGAVRARREQTNLWMIMAYSQGDFQLFFNA